MSILIGADFVPTSSNEELFSIGDIDTLFDEGLKGVLTESSFRIFNLEVPLTNDADPILKCGPNLRANPKAVNTFMKVPVNLFTIANNHIMDQGDSGLLCTMETLRKNGIQFVGAGKNLVEAKKPFSSRIDNKQVAVYACAEHEFSIATEEKYGANPHDPLDSFDDVANLSEHNDYVIVLYHGGKEFYRYPSPELQRSCRKYIDKGAKLVICQHSHCIGCEENYHGGKIVYGQGNFLFDYGNDEYWNTGMLVSVNDEEVSYIPFVKNGFGVRLANSEEKDEILKDFFVRSEEIKDKELLKQKYEQFADSYTNVYFRAFMGMYNGHIIYRAINRLLGHRLDKLYISGKYNKEDLAALYDYLSCEAHRELALECIQKLIKQPK